MRATMLSGTPFVVGEAAGTAVGGAAEGTAVGGAAEGTAVGGAATGCGGVTCCGAAVFFVFGAA